MVSFDFGHLYTKMDELSSSFVNEVEGIKSEISGAKNKLDRIAIKLIISNVCSSALVQALEVISRFPDVKYMKYIDDILWMIVDHIQDCPNRGNAILSSVYPEIQSNYITVTPSTLSRVLKTIIYYPDPSKCDSINTLLQYLFEHIKVCVK